MQQQQPFYYQSQQRPQQYQPQPLQYQPQQPLQYQPQPLQTMTHTILDKGYDASASLGKIMGLWFAGSGLFFSFILIIIGIIVVMKKNPRIITNATIKSADCKKITETNNNNKETIIDNCVNTITFVAKDNKTYESKISTTNKNYTSGETLKISYHEDNPNDVKQHVIRMSTVGWILIGLGILGLISSGFSMYLTLNYKMYQAAQGVGYATGAVVNAYGNVTD